MVVTTLVLSSLLPSLSPVLPTSSLPFPLLALVLLLLVLKDLVPSAGNGKRAKASKDLVVLQRGEGS